MHTNLVIALCFCLSGIMTQKGLAGVQEALAARDAGDEKTAFQEFSKLADAGDTKAMMEVGMAYHQGNSAVKQDYTKAMDWYLKALAKDNADALNNIGVLYRDGLGVKEDHQIAFAIFFYIHWAALGSDSTQVRAGSNFDKTAAKMTQKEMKESVDFTQEYIKAYIENRGKLDAQQAALKFSKTGHAIRLLSEITESRDTAPRHKLMYEVRFPAKASPSDNAKIDFVTEDTMSGGPISMKSKTSTGDYCCFSDQYQTDSAERHAFIVSEQGEPSQVFVLKLPSNAKPSDWTAWAKPNYNASGYASWDYMHGEKYLTLSTNRVQHPCEIRYKIAE